MKKFMKIMLLTFVLVATPILADQILAQPPTPPSAGNAGGTPMGGATAPIEGGLAIVITMAVSYGARKYSMIKKQTEKE